MNKIIFLFLCVAMIACDNRPLREQVEEQVSEAPMNTNDPSRGRNPQARKDAEGETGVGAGVKQNTSTNQENKTP